MTVTTYPEDLPAIARAIQSLEAEEKVLDRWAMHSVELSLALDDLRLLHARIADDQAALRESLAARLAYPEPRRLSDAWSAPSNPRLRAV
jgi:hypothetical protein